MDNTMLFKALREFTTGLLNQLLVNLAGQDGQLWLAEFKKFLRHEPCWIATPAAVVETAKKAKVYLRRLFETETITVGATDGTGTLKGSGVFPGGVYGLALPVGGKETPATAVAIYEMEENGTFAEVFGSLGENRLCWTEAQVVGFCRENPGRLSRTGATFFEMVGGFVADASFVGLGRLDVFVDPFSDGRVWNAKYAHRFVVPQQTPSS